MMCELRRGVPGGLVGVATISWFDSVLRTAFLLVVKEIEVSDVVVRALVR